jgi:hypothetical protein
MKLTQVRYFSHASIILICCCISIEFAAGSAAAPFTVPDWVELSPNNPPPARSYLAMTYDPVSGRVIMFGGFDGTGYLNDTWSFDGTTWTQIATQSAPLQRILPRDRLLCLAVSLTLTRITPGPMMARPGLCNLRLSNLSWCMALLPLSIRACKEWFSLEVEAVV